MEGILGMHITPLGVSAPVVALAFLVDAALGDPRWLPHPVRGMGALVQHAEGFLRRHAQTTRAQRWAGIVLVAAVLIPVFAAGYLVSIALAGATHMALSIAGGIIYVYLVASTIAARELVRSARAVIDAVREDRLEQARQRLGMIVGRDTHGLKEEGVLKATIETLAENLSDGVVAPVFYLVVGGLPLAMTYKAINTLDSMVGYRSDRYRHLGWAAARLDDAANYLPARLTGLLIVLATFIITLFRDAGDAPRASSDAFTVMLRDGRKHLSPNSGVSEAAIAGALGVRLGGPAAYGGIVVEKPYIGDNRESPENYLEASRRAVSITRAAAALSGILAVTALLIGGSPW